MLVLAYPLDRFQLRNSLSQLRLRGGVIDIGIAILQRLLGVAPGLDCLGFIQVVSTDRGIG